ncbi:uncharacterized protein LOC143474491 [Brachyhypopomus gauderio]|uniref:uncharacterized protein LOC143474491 n=1 Tax=Brachyhypopomus gauderio TaxID=698409 RepID=UPI004042DA4B
MNIFQLLCLDFLVITQCGSAVGVILQLESKVRVRAGFPTTLQCHVQIDGLFTIFWIKVPLNRPPVCIASAKPITDGVEMYGQFQNHSRIKVTWNKSDFNLSFSSVEQIDSATYICGQYNFGHLLFANGSTLILENHGDALEPTTIKDSKQIDEKVQLFSNEFLVPALAATNVASVFLIILLCHCLKKTKSGASGIASSAGDNDTDEVNYAAVTFKHKHSRTVPKKTCVTYGVVGSQEVL